MAKAAKEPADYILPLYMNGLEGRVMRLPDVNKKEREILFVYGQHSSLERWWGVAQALNKFGAVTMPDLPGLGGMTSLYKIGLPATIDNLADYLAAFIKLRYKKRNITIVGMSLGFVIVTRMLQRYPEMSKRIDDLVSVVGFAHHEDFIFSRKRFFCYKWGSFFLSGRLPAFIFQNVFAKPFYLRRVYAKSFNAKEKFANVSGDEFKRTMDMEIELWKLNDIRTQMKTGHEMLTLDDTGVKINLPLLHVASKKDRYFNHVRVEEHLRMVYKDIKIFFTTDPNHAPTVIADAKAASPFFPPGVRRILRKKPRSRK